MNEDNREREAVTRTPEIIGAEIRALTASMLSNVIEIGRRMCEVKELLPYGSFGDWIRTETGYSSSTANNFMRVYQEYGGQTSLFGSEAESQTLGKLSYSKALALLAVPAEERERVAEELDAEHLSTRELQEAIRERDEAIARMKEAQARERDIQTDLQLKECELETARQEARTNAKENLATIADLSRKVEKLERRPVDVAVQAADPAEIEAAVTAALEKAREESKAELDKLSDALKAREAETEKLKGKLKTAEAAAEAAKKRADEGVGPYKEQAQRLEAEAERLRKELAMADPVTAEFKGVFEQAAALVPKLLALAERAPESTADKLRAALKALGKQLSGEGTPHPSPAATPSPQGEG